MTDESEIIRDPEFQKLLKIRSRWRWGLSGGLVGGYLVHQVLESLGSCVQGDGKAVVGTGLRAAENQLEGCGAASGVQHLGLNVDSGAVYRSGNAL